jgi:hypothetical protein
MFKMSTVQLFWSPQTQRSSHEFKGQLVKMSSSTSLGMTSGSTSFKSYPTESYTHFPRATTTHELPNFFHLHLWNEAFNQFTVLGKKMDELVLIDMRFGHTYGAMNMTLFSRIGRRAAYRCIKKRKKIKIAKQHTPQRTQNTHHCPSHWGLQDYKRAKHN